MLSANGTLTLWAHGGIFITPFSFSVIHNIRSCSFRYLGKKKVFTIIYLVTKKVRPFKLSELYPRKLSFSNWKCVNPSSSKKNFFICHVRFLTLRVSIFKFSVTKNKKRFFWPQRHRERGFIFYIINNQMVNRIPQNNWRFC